MALPTNITPGTSGHAALHNQTNAAVNALDSTVAGLAANPGGQGAQGVGVTSITDSDGDGVATVTLTDPKTGTSTTSQLPLPRGLDAFPVFAQGADTSGLPVGTVFGIYSTASTAAPTVKGFCTGYLASATSFSINPTSPTGSYTSSGGSAPASGDLMILSIVVPDPEEATGGSSAITWTKPSGWNATPDISPQGTMKPFVFAGTAASASAVTFASATAVNAQYSLVWLSGADVPANVIVGATKRRTDTPTETLTVTCPSVSAPGFSIALSIAWERTLAAETATHTWTSGWASVSSAAQGADNSLTTEIASKTVLTSGATGNAVCTYPNAQANNGLGLQLIVPGVQS